MYQIGLQTLSHQSKLEESRKPSKDVIGVPDWHLRAGLHQSESHLEKRSSNQRSARGLVKSLRPFAVFLLTISPAASFNPLSPGLTVPADSPQLSVSHPVPLGCQRATVRGASRNGKGAKDSQAEWTKASEGRTLVIVESPTKAKTIKKFLADAEMHNYVVDFSAGHVRDLSKEVKSAPKGLKDQILIEELRLNAAQLGVDVQNDFEPVYAVMPEKEDVVKRLTKLSKTSSRILLATDEDREGEAISWHLLETLQPAVPVKRAVFHEITRSAIMEAFNNPRDIDVNLVQSQETRRIVDRLTGFTISPLLWRFVATGLSAGRVQSCGLDMISEREKARWAFRPSKYYSIDAWFAPADESDATPIEMQSKLDTSRRSMDREVKLSARLVQLKGQKVAVNGDFDGSTGELKRAKELPVVLGENDALEILQWLSGANGSVPQFVLADREDKKLSRSAPAPFITSTLQQEASRALGLSPARAMSVAQELYEKGFITYMRTDSPLLSSVAREAAESHIREMFGEDYLSGGKGGAKGKKAAPKNAQEAHEAIRPAEVHGRFRPPFETGLEGAALKLYSLIYRRTLASLMVNCESLSTTYTIDVADGAAALRTSGTRIVFPGFMAALRMPVDKAYNPVPFTNDVGLPEIKVGTEMDLLSGPVRELTTAAPSEEEENQEEEEQSKASQSTVGLSAREHVTRAPSRFTEASFVKELETAGVGRPSTYATILSILHNRGYVNVDRHTLVPTLTGMIVAGLLKTHFAQIVEPTFTASMEAGLDVIAAGKGDKVTFLSDFYLGSCAEEDSSLGLMPAVAKKLQPGEIEYEESRRLALPGLDEIATIVAGRSNSAYVEEVLPEEASAEAKKPRRWKLPETLMQDIRALTPEAVEQVMSNEVTVDGAALGVDPETKRSVWLRSGRYGKYLEVGEEGAKAKDKTTCSVPAWLEPTHTIEQVLQFTKLPIEVGPHPALGIPMLVDVHQKNLSVGVKGFPYRAQLPDNVFPMQVDRDMAASLLPDAQKITNSKRVLGRWDEKPDSPEVVVQIGRFGPYVMSGNILAGIGKQMDPATVTLELAIEILETRGKEKGSKRKSASKKAKTASAKKAGTTNQKTNAYNVFCSEMHSKIKEQNPGIKSQQIFKEIAAQWKSLDDEEKAAYKAKANDASVGDEKQATSKRKVNGASAGDRKQIATRRPTGYQLFFKERNKFHKLQNPGMKTGEIMKKVPAEWKALDDKSKAEYKDRAAAVDPKPAEKASTRKAAAVNPKPAKGASASKPVAVDLKPAEDASASKAAAVEPKPTDDATARKQELLKRRKVLLQKKKQLEAKKKQLEELKKQKASERRRSLQPS